jgi:outer membrane PBP1 activator LpoA protein
MSTVPGFSRGRLARGVTAVLLLGIFLTGCQRQTPRATDFRSLQQHADDLKKQHQREMQNK